ncbi:MAG: hypothetical protein J3K34DRAFT_398663 [Monoraphidium minutum]|nr:MAG: hypothetical protein J3K34DRAFT_398663 [Monoraphidium minutum]
MPACRGAKSRYIQGGARAPRGRVRVHLSLWPPAAATPSRGRGGAPGGSPLGVLLPGGASLGARSPRGFGAQNGMHIQEIGMERGKTRSGARAPRGRRRMRSPAGVRRSLAGRGGLQPRAACAPRKDQNTWVLQLGGRGERIFIESRAEAAWEQGGGAGAPRKALHVRAVDGTAVPGAAGGRPARAVARK